MKTFLKNFSGRVKVFRGRVVYIYMETKKAAANGKPLLAAEGRRRFQVGASADGRPETLLGFDQVYDRFAKDVWRICMLYLGNPEDAKDASQETFLRYWRTDNKPSGENHTKAWLIVTAGNVCKNMLKRQDRRQVPLDSLPEIGTEDGEPAGLLPALQQLPDRWKNAIYLYYYEDMPAKDIAQAMGVSESAVFVCLSKGRKRLKELLEEERS